MITKKIFGLGMILLLGVLLIGIGSAAGSFSSSNPQVGYPSGSSASYLAGQGIQLYGSPAGSNTCGAGQDFVLQIHPFGCSPTIIPSDLLEEQNVPVFCPVVATQINPLITIKAIDSMTFSGNYPKEVSGVGFHPAKAAVSSTTSLINYPILENVGYVVIVLKQNINESSMPDHVTGNLSARVRYNIQNAFGMGDFNFRLPQISDEEWDSRYKEFSFWQGKGFLRVEEVLEDSAVIGVYEDSEDRVTSFTLKPGQSSDKIYLRASYCLAGLKVKLEALENPNTRVRLKVNGDYTEVNLKERFLENRCIVNEVKKQGLVKSALISCRDDNGKNRNLQFSTSPKVSVNVKVGESSFAEGNLQLGDKIGALNGDYYIAHVDSKDNSYENKDLIVWVVKVSEKDKNSYVTNNKLNSVGIANYMNVILKAKSVYTGGKLEKYDIWKLEFGKEATIEKSNDIKLNGYAGVSSGESIATIEKDKDKYGENYVVAQGDYKTLATEFKNVGKRDSYAREISGAGTYSEDGLKKAIELASFKKDYIKKTELLQMLGADYPSAENLEYIKTQSSDYLNSAEGVLSQSVYIGAQYKQIDFIDVYEPNFDDYGVEITVSDETAKIMAELSKSEKTKIITAKESELNKLKSELIQINGEIKRINAEKENFYDNPRQKEIIDKGTYDFISPEETKIIETYNNYNAQLDSLANSESQKNSEIQVAQDSIDKLKTETSQNLPAEISQYQLIKGTRQSLQAGYITLKDLNENYAVFDVNIENIARSQLNVRVNYGETYNGYKYSIRLDKIHLTKVAKVSISADIDRTGTDANISYSIPIEKRAIDLSPDRINQMIKDINKTITNWEDKSEKLGKVVDTMQKACIATMGALVVKNILFSSGGATAESRKMTMTEVRSICNKKVAEGQAKDLKDCINQNGDLIDKIQRINEGIVEDTNAKAEPLRELLNQEKGEDKYRVALAKQVTSSSIYSDAEKDEILAGAEAGTITTEEIRDYDFRKSFISKSRSDGELKDIVDNYNKKNTDLLKVVNEETSSIQKRIALEKDLTEKGFKDYSVRTSITERKGQQQIWDGKTLDAKDIKLSSGGDYGKGTKNVQFVKHDDQLYLAVLRDSSSGDKYGIEGIYKVDTQIDGVVTIDKSQDIQNQFSSFKKAGNFKIASINPQVKYFGSGTDKDYPAIVPFPFPGRENNGYYVGIRHLGTGSAYTASGNPRSYFVCNSGDNAVIDFNPEINGFSGGDTCVSVTIEAGRLVGPSEQFDLGTQTNSLYVKAYEALKDAERKFGKKGTHDILGMTANFGQVAFDIPQLQCEDFMSPGDCDWLFNLCDPVICPSSRCDFGGVAPQANVIQSGIIGSILLCLPNFNVDPTKGVLIPVCLTGLKAGIDGYLSIAKSHRDCLIEKQQTGANIGICDEVYSIYLCEFFWQQATPLKDIIIPKILDMLSGRGWSARGGGEYLGGESTWSNAKSSMDYFTKSYATNAYEAFKVNAINEVKNEVCKNSLSGVFPEISALESMTEPSSPPQFYAKFEEVPFTDATIPPTSHYRVYYHIFAGETSGVNYQIYMKSPEGTSIYSVNPIFFVDGNYIPVGGTVDLKKDFVAPSGYNKLCVRVNNQEECDFKEVTTSFAVNYISDKYLETEAKTTGITNQAACISGGTNIYGIPNTNVQSAASNYLSSDIYQQGITRVCATSNPGGDNNTKWKNVGYCDDVNVKCWVDTSTVEQAIKNKDLEKNAINEVSASDVNALITGGYMRLDNYNAIVEELNKILLEGGEGLSSVAGRVTPLISGGEPTDSDPKVLFDWQKAQLTLFKALAYDGLARFKVPQEAIEVKVLGTGEGPVYAIDGIRVTPENIPIICDNVNDLNDNEKVTVKSNDKTESIVIPPQMREECLNSGGGLTQAQKEETAEEIKDEIIDALNEVINPDEDAELVQREQVDSLNTIPVSQIVSESIESVSLGKTLEYVEGTNSGVKIAQIKINGYPVNLWIFLNPAKNVAGYYYLVACDSSTCYSLAYIQESSIIIFSTHANQYDSYNTLLELSQKYNYNIKTHTFTKK